MTTPEASRFDRLLARLAKRYSSEVTILWWDRTEGAADEHGDPAITYTTSTITAIVGESTRQLLQAEAGVIEEYSRTVYVSRSETIEELDKVTLDGEEYIVGVVETKRPYKTFIARRRIQ